MATLPEDDTPIFNALQKEYVAKIAYDIHFPEESDDDQS